MTTTHLTSLAQHIHAGNAAKGFWDAPRPLTETTMLIVTELAEAIEEDRAEAEGVYYRDTPTGDVYDDRDTYEDTLTHLVHTLDPFGGSRPLKPEGVDVELIDALIRLLDLLGARGTNVDALIAQKLAYNAQRPTKHGKTY